jgi:hypothetical protein
VGVYHALICAGSYPEQKEECMQYKDLDSIRRALFGFEEGYRYRGWLDRLFDEEILYPYLNLYKRDAQALLYKKGIFGKLAPIFAKQLRITSIVNKLIGIDLLSSRQQGPSLIEEIAKVILEEQETRRTLDQRVSELDKKLTQEGRLFAGLAHVVNLKESVPTLSKKTSDLTGVLVSIQASLNHVNAIAGFDPALSQALQDTKAKWTLSDVPFFAMRENRHHSGKVVAVLIDPELEPIFENGIPFLESCGWYPYVTVYGVFREAVSPQRPVNGIELAWLKYRKPQYPDENYAKTLEQILTAKRDPSYGYHSFMDDTPADHLLYLSAIQLAHETYKIEFNNASSSIKRLVTQARATVQMQMPAGMSSFF